jgi:beta-1,4-mannosyl-glycoprotein beta-1,4-N-acetylglucosaminyltransferase
MAAITTEQQVVKLYDVFVYNGDPIVPLRLRLLAPFVDEFIITESWYTHVGEKKPFLWIDRNRDTVFAPYLHKIHFQIIEAFPPMPADWPHRQKWHNPQDWWPEYYQRDRARVRLDELSSGAFVAICSDADEIVRPELARRLRGMWQHLVAGGEPVHLEMQFFYYNFRWVKRGSWAHAFVLTDETCHRRGPTATLSAIRAQYPCNRVLPDAGWHCSYFMSRADLRRKIRSFAHQEFNQSRFTADAHVGHCLDTGKDLFDRGPYEDLVEHNGHRLPDGWREFQAELIAAQAGEVKKEAENPA